MREGFCRKMIESAEERHSPLGLNLCVKMLRQGAHIFAQGR